MQVLHNVGQGGGDGPDGDAGRVFNPPLVHGIATLPDDTPRPFARLVAAARGDGVVGLYDADAMWQPRGCMWRHGGTCVNTWPGWPGQGQILLKSSCHR